MRLAAEAEDEDEDDVARKIFLATDKRSHGSKFERSRRSTIYQQCTESTSL